MSQLAGLVALLLLSSPAAGLIAGANREQSETAPQAKLESEFDAKRREEVSKNPLDVSFIIRLAGDKMQFRQGEIIPLEMSFASSLAKTYRMNAATYDQSGRLNLDKFHIEPEKKLREPLKDGVRLTVIELGTEDDLHRIFSSVISSKGSISETDQEELKWYFQNYNPTLPESIPNKEVLAFVGALIPESPALKRHVKTATDVLRLAVAMSGGDVSLAENTRFRSFTRRERRALLELLENCDNSTEDMLRWNGRWIRLGERLHSGEYKNRFPNAASLNSFTGQKFSDLPECRAGWMMRERPNSGEIFEPKTVQDKIDVASETTICIPVILDLKERKVVWADLGLKRNPRHVNNVQGNSSQMTLIGKSITKVVKPDLYSLFLIHADARGSLVEEEGNADTVFSLEKGITPFDLETITSEYL